MESLVLNKDNVKLKVKASDWEEAVRIGAGMLVEQGCAKQSYVCLLYTSPSPRD